MSVDEELYVLSMTTVDGASFTSSTRDRADIRQEATRHKAFKMTLSHWQRSFKDANRHPMHGWRLKERYDL